MLGHLIDDRVWMLKLPGQTRDRALSADQGQGKTGHLAGVDVEGGDDVDVDHIMRDVESQRRRAPKGAEPAWRRLERVMEERRTAELLSDFDDYEIDSDDVEAQDGEDKPARKRSKKTR